jgi:hypothetical protein
VGPPPPRRSPAMEVFCKCNRWFDTVELWRAHLPCAAGKDPRTGPGAAGDRPGAERPDRAARSDG